MAKALILAMSLIGIGGTGMIPASQADPVAVVNGTAITDRALNRSVDAYFRARRMDAGGMFNPRVFERVKRRVLDTLIAQELLYQQARDLEVAVSESRIERSISRDAARQVTREAFLDELRINGFTPASYARETRKRLMVEQYVREYIAARVTVDEREIEARYREAGETLRLPERVQLRQILLRVTPAADAQTVERQRQRLQALREQLADGADFAQLATAHSQGPNAGRGGDMGMQALSALVQPFAELARTLEPGALSPVFRTQHGWHLVRLEQRAGSEMPSLERAHESLAAELWAQKLNQRIESHVADLREQGEIRVLLE